MVPPPSFLPDPTRGGRQRARVSMPRLSFVLCSRAVESYKWFPRAVSVHGGLTIQHGCQWPSLRGRICAASRRCLGAVESQSLQKYEGSEVTRGNDVIATYLTPINEYFSKIVKIRLKITNCFVLYLIIIVVGQENYDYN